MIAWVLSVVFVGLTRGVGGLQLFQHSDLSVGLLWCWKLLLFFDLSLILFRFVYLVVVLFIRICLCVVTLSL